MAHRSEHGPARQALVRRAYDEVAAPLGVQSTFPAAPCPRGGGRSDFCTETRTMASVR